MVLFAAGAFLVVLGLFCGGVLTLAPLGLLATVPTHLLLWVLFPLLLIVGYTLVATAGQTAQIRSFTFGMSCVLLLMALAAITGVVLAAAAILPATGSSLSLWYVLAVAGTLGVLGVAASRPVPGQT